MIKDGETRGTNTRCPVVGAEQLPDTCGASSTPPRARRKDVKKDDDIDGSADV